MKLIKIIPILVLSTFSSIFISSCDSNIVKITYKLVRIQDGEDILKDRLYSFTAVYEKNHEYSYDDYDLASRQMSTYYYDSGASRLSKNDMDFGKLYLYKNAYSNEDNLLLKVGDIFIKDDTYVCFSDYTPISNS